MQRNREGWRPVAAEQSDDQPESVRLVSDEFAGWVFTVRFDEQGDVVGFAMDAVPAVERLAFTAGLVHSVGVGAAVSMARTSASFLARSRARRVARSSSRGSNERFVELLESGQSAELAQWGALVSERTGTRGKPDAIYAKVAAEYLRLIDAGERAPTARVASLFNISPATARNTVYEARRRGLLSKVKQGASGGTLTAKGRRALQEDNAS